MGRIEAFKKRVSEGHYRTLALRLESSEFDECVDFIEENDGLDHLNFEYLANRWKLDQPKTKNHSIMVELVMVANSAAKGDKNE